MGWGFRKRIKIMPGVTLNVGKKSVGVSVGPRGARTSINSNGTRRTTVSIPGTGISHTSVSRAKQRTDQAGSDSGRITRLIVYGAGGALLFSWVMSLLPG